MIGSELSNNLIVTNQYDSSRETYIWARVQGGFRKWSRQSLGKVSGNAVVLYVSVEHLDLPSFFHFHAFLGENYQIIDWLYPFGLSAPSLGNP